MPSSRNCSKTGFVEMFAFLYESAERIPLGVPRNKAQDLERNVPGRLLK